MISTVVVLPAPFGPRNAKDLAAFDLEVDPRNRLRAAVALAEAADRDHNVVHGRGMHEVACLVSGHFHRPAHCRTNSRAVQVDPA
jgi:hypothetical protein